MASSLFTRTFVGLKSIRSSPCLLKESRYFTSFLRGRASFARVPYPSLVSSTNFIHCSASRSPGAKVSKSFHSMAHDESIVSPDWLQSNLRNPDVKVLDASWYMPDEKRNPFQEYQVAHIPGALFFDVDRISDRKSDLPHMLPSEEAFAAAVSALDIHNKDGVVVYDGKGLFSAARVWWMFRVFGHDKVWVLDGGLPLWRASEFDVESSASGDEVLKANAAIEAVEKVYGHQFVGPTTFVAKLQRHLIWTLEQVRGNINSQTHQHVDARSKVRFDGAAPEPRKGIRSGHVPGSKCIPFGQVSHIRWIILVFKFRVTVQISLFY
ncbi:thiosulfate/3-mercaptopyruvate sulfurtransferase 1, mitochondrial-like isoform X1 [Dendrobium catenatum]|uniref:thiosulfate/3-mercaptopyruvate sulfurtransferase 1, mitochondrial-like isoform X1 n=2 Tax=Dendrobium catenatum TaxID=906689 RepID=UPI00109F3900|nr:thiosulfate/3-mercaptopyruvate sulfurtransferase 1, mitochondrial-like isoform X1 [Dendrobium catenatum]